MIGEEVEPLLMEPDSQQVPDIAGGVGRRRKSGNSFKLGSPDRRRGRESAAESRPYERDKDPHVTEDGFCELNFA